MIIYHVRVKCASAIKDPLLDDDVNTKNCCCCCHSKGEKECCSRCGHCCLGYESNPNRKRINNSCCCNNCCACCIDCCVDCCGDKLTTLPEGVTDADIVYLTPTHRIIYQPDPNAPVTMSGDNAPAESLEGLAGVGALSGRHYVGEQFFLMNRPAVFYSDLNHPAVGVRVPSDVARRQDATVHRPHGHPQPADALQLHHGARDPHQQRATECGAERAAKPDSAACDSPPASERGTPVCNYRRTALHHANYQLVSLLTNTTDHRVLDSQTLNASSKGKHDRDDSQVPVFPCLDAGSG